MLTERTRKLHPIIWPAHTNINQKSRL